MRMTHARTTRTRIALAALVAGATLASGCVQYGSGRGRSVPIEDEDHGGEGEDAVEPETPAVTEGATDEASSEG